jgi:hypothetical protein
MRRISASAVIFPFLLLLLAAPVAAAPPVKGSSTQDFLSAFATSCGPSTCTDTSMDVFTIGDGLMIVCVSEFTFNVRSGRVVSQESGCSDPVSADAVTVSDDLSSGSLAPTSVTFVDCNQRGCVEGDTVTVSAELTGFGLVFSDTQRGTFTDGTCTVKFSSSGDQRQATGTLTIDGNVLSAGGNIGSGTFSFMERCRE